MTPSVMVLAAWSMPGPVLKETVDVLAELAPPVEHAASARARQPKRGAPDCVTVHVPPNFLTGRMGRGPMRARSVARLAPYGGADPGSQADQAARFK